MVTPWKGTCYDDGTGRNVLFVDEDGQRQRKVPDNFVPEVFPTGERKYYFRGICIRCRAPSPSVFLFKPSDYIGYSLNICESCMLSTLGDINNDTISTGTGKINVKGKGEQIWQANEDTPKHFYKDLKYSACNPDRELEIIERAKESRHYVRTAAKLRRNQERSELIKQKAIEFNIHQGEHLSWGFDTYYDEYYGEINNKNQPHGMGVKFYSDGSIYVGEWQEGKQHTMKRSIWQRPDGSQYEGSWVNGYKHGVGVQIFPDGTRYSGEYAKGYEHGQGKKIHIDNSVFVGRFRFGKKDGPGVLTTPEGGVEKRVFKESDVYHEKPIPEIVEIDQSDRKYFEPLSLMSICITALANTMVKKRYLVSSALLTTKIPSFLKELISKKFLLTIYPKGSEEFLNIAPLIAFQNNISCINFKSIRFSHYDGESLLYFIQANKEINEILLSMNRLDSSSIDMFTRYLLVRTWPRLHTLELSYNRTDVNIIKNLIAAVEQNPTLEVLRLAGCNINAIGASMVAKFLEGNRGIRELDLSFNVLQVAGAESLAEAIPKNNTLVYLNLRNNNIGSIGGQALVDSLRYNSTLRELCLVDNKIGFDVMSLLAARLRATPSEIVRCVRAKELEVPIIHLEKEERKKKLRH